MKKMKIPIRQKKTGKLNETDDSMDLVDDFINLKISKQNNELKGSLQLLQQRDDEKPAIEHEKIFKFKTQKKSAKKINEGGPWSILSDFADSFPLTTNISCWWCCHQFTDHPLGVPHKVTYQADSPIFHLLGCFCSFSCILAYIKSGEYKGKCTKIDLIYMYKKIVPKSLQNFDEINSLLPAPPRCCLDKFGGHMSIEEFRNYSSLSYEVQLVYAPMLAETVYCELKPRSNNDKLNNIVVKKAEGSSRENIQDKEEESGKKIKRSKKKTLDKFVSFQ